MDWRKFPGDPEKGKDFTVRIEWDGEDGSRRYNIVFGCDPPIAQGILWLLSDYAEKPAEGGDKDEQTVEGGSREAGAGGGGEGTEAGAGGCVAGAEGTEATPEAQGGSGSGDGRG